jgi:hypothetical protein
VDHYLVCERPDVTTPAEVAACLRATGHAAEVTMEKHWGVTAVTYELAIQPNRTRVMVFIEDDLHGDADNVTSDLEVLDDLVAEGKMTEAERARVRRFVYVGHWDHADTATVDALIGLLMERMGAARREQ